eukprot:6487334-Amphidinium_carterae.2
MKRLQHHTQIEDKAVPDLLLKGMPIVGEGLSLPHFRCRPSAPVINLPHLPMGAPAHRIQLARKAMAYRPRDLPALQAERNCLEGTFTGVDINDLFGPCGGKLLQSCRMDHPGCRPLLSARHRTFL